MPIRFVTDSTANLPPDVERRFGIKVLHIYLFFGEEEHREGETLSYADFMNRLTSAKVPPQTSPPTSAEFVKAYEELIAQGADAILSVHVSSKLSNTFRNACIAKEMVSRTHPHVKIFPVDSELVDLALGSCLEEAAELAQQGKSADELVAYLQKICKAVRVYAYVDTLEYLKRGGRVTKLAAFFGGLLNVKPILKLENGQLDLAEKVSGQEKALETILEMLKKEIPQGRSLDIGVADCLSEQLGDQFLQTLKAQFNCRRTRRASLSPSVAIHTGPGALAAAYRVLD